MSSKVVKALKNNEMDNVATVFGTGVEMGSKVEVSDPKGERIVVTALESIPYGHKIALSPIAKGSQVTKYGEEIGIASADITVGEHVHVHNIESIRGRGDWDMEKQEEERGIGR